MTTINGLPAHGLLVHVIVVFIPLAAVLLVVVACWPPARRRLSAFTAIVAAVELSLWSTRPGWDHPAARVAPVMGGNGVAPL